MKKKQSGKVGWLDIYKRIRKPMPPPGGPHSSRKYDRRRHKRNLRRELNGE